MKIQTKYHGNIEINKEGILHFENGIPGFLEENEFIVLDLPDNDVFFILQSVQTSEIGFVIINPFSFFKDYEFKLDDSLLMQLGLENEEDVQVFVILTVQEPFEKTTANLQGPVVINRKNNKAKQVILNDSIYTTKHPVFEQIKEKVKG
jgi:flagellar assembly factor FliW